MSDLERSYQDIKEEVRARTDIVEIIGQYTTLRRAGRNWTGLCPFHPDKRIGSFTVNPQLQVYRCWSCGAKGDIFEAIQQKEKLDFLEALEYLAKRAGVLFERHKGDPQQVSEREQAQELNRMAVAYFKDCLARSSDARDILARRKLLKSTQEQWDIGFATSDWEGLVFYLQRKRADLALATKIGLVKARENGSFVDGFRNRLMFPIHNNDGDVIAFGGRAIDDHPAKYLNSPASLIFDKGRTLYGLYFARKKLSGANGVPPIFVEGYMDVITAHQAGFTQCVATLGTAMTENHARMLSRYSTRVLLCYDADGAGINAALKGATIWEQLGIDNAEVRVVRLPDGDDPDSLLRDHPNGTAIFQKSIDDAIPRVDFEIEMMLRRHNPTTQQGRADALSELIPILATLRHAVQRDRYAQQYAYLSPMHNYDLGRAITSILRDVENYTRQQGHTARDQGYPLTQQTNGTPLQQQPPPPTYRPAAPNQWGKLSQPDATGIPGTPAEQWPNTQQVLRRGDRDGYRSGNQGGGYGGRKNGNRRTGPIGDPTPPSLQMPAQTGAEKAERQLLRALFSADWRVYILGRLQPDLLVTSLGKRLFGIIARTPAGPDGSIDPLQILSIAQEEDRNLADKRASIPKGQFFLEDTGFIGTGKQENSWQETKRDTREAPHSSGIEQEFETGDSPSFADTHPTAEFGTELFRFVQEILEDSTFLVSNERVNEKVIDEVIKALQRHRDLQEMRARQVALRDIDRLPPDEQRAAMDKLLEKMRALRGSPPNKESAPESE